MEHEKIYTSCDSDDYRERRKTKLNTKGGYYENSVGNYPKYIMRNWTFGPVANSYPCRDIPTTKSYFLDSLFNFLLPVPMCTEMWLLGEKMKTSLSSWVLLIVSLVIIAGHISQLQDKVNCLEALASQNFEDIQTIKEKLSLS